MSQLSFSEAEYVGKRKKTRREEWRGWKMRTDYAVNAVSGKDRG